MGLLGRGNAVFSVLDPVWGGGGSFLRYIPHPANRTQAKCAAIFAYSRRSAMLCGGYAVLADPCGGVQHFHLSPLGRQAQARLACMRGGRISLLALYGGTADRLSCRPYNKARPAGAQIYISGNLDPARPPFALRWQKGRTAFRQGVRDALSPSCRKARAFTCVAGLRDG